MSDHSDSATMPNRRNASTRSAFYGWWIVAIEFITLGIALGIPYYNLPFFYDYFQKTFHWSWSQITLGFPLAALLTVWVGPIVIPRFSPRKLIIVGTGLTALSFMASALCGAPSPFISLCILSTRLLISKLVDIDVNCSRPRCSNSERWCDDH